MTVNTFPEYITARLKTPFEYGKFDCILFVFGWVKQATGIDYLAEVPSWTSAKQAMRMVDDMGGMEAILDSKFERINPHLALDGDIAVREGAAHLFSGAHIVGTGENGLLFADRMQAEAAWLLSKSIQPAQQRDLVKE